jgi:ABC-2 type transport system permease protein
MSTWARIARWPFWAMLRKEFIQMRRDRMTLAMMIGIPAIQLALFGYAIQTEVRHLPTVVWMNPQRAAGWCRRCSAPETSIWQARFGTARRGTRSESGRARAGIVIPPDFERDLKRGRTATAQSSSMQRTRWPPPRRSAAPDWRARSLCRAGSGARVGAAISTGQPWYNPALRAHHARSGSSGSYSR